MKVVLVCAFGMSTSLLTSNMLKVAEPGDEVTAIPVTDLRDSIANYDVVLLGPQVRYLLTEVQQTGESVGVPVGVIDQMAYAMMDGSAAMKQARSLIAG